MLDHAATLSLSILAGLISVFLWETTFRETTKGWLRKWKSRKKWERLARDPADFHAYTSSIPTADGKSAVRDCDILVRNPFSRKFPYRETRPMLDAPNLESPTQNILIVGSPKYNEVATALQKRYLLPFEYVFETYSSAPEQKVLKLVSCFGEEYIASPDTHSKEPSPPCDYAIVFVHWVADRLIMWTSGIHGYGSVGAWLYLDQHADQIEHAARRREHGCQWLLRIAYDPQKPEEPGAILRTDVVGDALEVRQRPQPTEQPKALICDFGNVLMFFDRSRTYRSIANKLGVEYTSIEERIGDAALLRAYETGTLSTEDFYSECAERLADLGDVPYSLFCESWSDIFWPNTDLIQAIGHLQGQVQLVLLSNTNPLHFEHVRQHYPEIIEPFGDNILLSYEIGSQKPAPESYHAALSHLPAGTNPDRCLLIDDLAENLDGAEIAGFQILRYHRYTSFVYQLRTKGLYVP